MIFASAGGTFAADQAATGTVPTAGTVPAAIPAAIPVATVAGTVPAVGTVPTTAPAPAPQVAPAVPGRAEWAVDSGDKPVKVCLGSLDKKNTGYLFQAELITNGSAVNTIKLAEYFATVDDDRLHKKLADEAAYEAQAAANPAKYRGHYCLLNPVSVGATDYLPLQTRAIRVQRPGMEALKWDLTQGQWRIQPLPASVPADGQGLAMTWTLWHDPNFNDASKPAAPQPFLRLTKTYTLKKGTYSMGVSLKVENLSSGPLTVTVDQGGPTGVPEEMQQARGGDSRDAAAGKYNFTDHKVDLILKKAGDLGKATLDQPMPLGTSKEGLIWIGHTNKYFGSMMCLISPDSGSPVPVDFRAEFSALPVRETETSRTWVTSIRLPDLNLASGQGRQIDFDLYAGPKKRDILEGQVPPGEALYRDMNYIGVIDFSAGGCSWCTFAWLTFGMMWLLEKFALLSLGNYGVAIILLVVLVRVVLHPLTKKGQVSMMKMQKLAPAMAKIKEKYANDKEALNREMMQVYKKQGATPILGCLPMLLQMPIWIALWTALSNSIELRHAAFLPVWIVDLAAPDSLVTFSHPLSVPLVSLLMGPLHGLNLLPLLLTVAMFLQTKLTPTQAAATPEAAKQQKMMMYMMPAMMLFIFYTAPSGLTLYIMASTFAGVAEQYVIRGHIRKQEALEAAAEQTIVAPGRGPRGSRPKKAKGPFWTKH